MKKCAQCKQTLPKDYFWKDKHKASGRNPYCKTCMLVRRKSTDARPRSCQRSKLKLRYGITEFQYEMMWAAQGGVCAICHKSNHQKNRLAVDHDHVTKKLRGLLCNACNSLLGYAKDSPAILHIAITYLNLYNSMSDIGLEANRPGRYPAPKEVTSG